MDNASMETYYGTKRINARPMSCKEYFCNHTQREVPDGMDPERDGYLVEYPGSDNYQSWSPKEPFDDAYQMSGSMNFGHALQALKDGHRVSRKGWNGNGMWLATSCDGTKTIPAENFWSPHNSKFAHNNGGSAAVAPCVTMKNANSEIQMGWAPSQQDMFANDWCVLENDNG